ncbi:unnamed protein product [Trichogramma brassicae]|uniref:Uncharacterized protein n=1 Tax=Trichogramma brassicae TaxID=86971 RepID=A0A6H5I5G9_9HYME|nr:unnamed protein product [Trichogramma brassicae]
MVKITKRALCITEFFAINEWYFHTENGEQRRYKERQGSIVDGARRRPAALAALGPQMSAGLCHYHVRGFYHYLSYRNLFRGHYLKEMDSEYEREVQTNEKKACLQLYEAMKEVIRKHYQCIQLISVKIKLTN